MRHCTVEHFQRLAEGAPVSETPTTMVSLAQALERVMKPWPRKTPASTIDIGLPEPHVQKLAELCKFRGEDQLGLALAYCLSRAVESARRTNLTHRFAPQRIHSNARHRVRVTMAPWLAASVKLVAHCCEVPISDVAAWAIELEAGRSHAT